MNRALRGPGDRYRVRVELLDRPGGQAGVRCGADAGLQLDRTDSHRFMVTLGTLCALVLVLGENGITVEQVLLMEVESARIRAVITAGAAAPDWLPNESHLLVFEGDRRSVPAQVPRFLPLEGMAEERSWPREESVTLDGVAVAVGQAVRRANARLARECHPAGTALVQRVTVRLAVQQAQIDKGRLLVSLSPEGGESGQYVEFTLGTELAAEGLEGEEEFGEGEEDEPGP